MAFPILLLAFITVPIIEIGLLLRVGAAIGGGVTLLIVIFTAVLGAYLVRQQGFATLQAVQQQMNAGRVPALEMAEGLALLIAGAVLLTPGFVTDALGFLLLTPVFRRALIHWYINKSKLTVHSAGNNTPQAGRPGASTIIEGEYSERE